MFRRLSDPGLKTVPFRLNGREAAGVEGDSVAAALLAAGEEACRTTPVRGVPRGPYCMMGVCFDCLVEIDGVGNRQGCLVPLRAGMNVRTQDGTRKLDR